MAQLMEEVTFQTIEGIRFKVHGTSKTLNDVLYFVTQEKTRPENERKSQATQAKNKQDWEAIFKHIATR